jgi:hypothetical protein
VKHAVQRGILGTNSAFAPGSRNTTENLDRVGRSQNLPDAVSANGSWSALCNLGTDLTENTSSNRSYIVA